MTLSYDETKGLIKQVLVTDISEARDTLNAALKAMGCLEPEFYEGIKTHGLGIELTTVEWFDLLTKIPSRSLRDERKIMSKNSESQRDKLPPATIG